MTDKAAPKAAAAARAMILPLALVQFIASYAATNMNVAISAIATDDEVLHGLLDVVISAPEIKTDASGPA